MQNEYETPRPITARDWCESALGVLGIIAILAVFVEVALTVAS